MSAPTEQELPRIGDFVAAKYRVEEVLGRGGMGAVFRVTHAVTGKSFAVKWLLPQHHAGQEVAQRFIREAQVAGRVDHPNVVEVYDIGEDRGSLYMVMELLQGESLAQHLARVGRVQANQACQLMIAVARGLAAAHRSGVIHRDLKPDNIFLSVSTLGEPRPKLLDFGISKMSALASDANPALTREGVVMGTPNYMAPEQLRSHQVDERCDVYALGVILYQMLSGKLPFVGENFPDLMLKIISDTPAPLAKAAPETPRELIAIVERAMARSPAERFDSVAELGRALEPFGQGALFDVDPKLSTRPPSSILPGPATPVATESRFPDPATQPLDLLQRARRLAIPLAVSALCALVFSWIYASTGTRHDASPSAALRRPTAQRPDRSASAQLTAAKKPDQVAHAATDRSERDRPLVATQRMDEDALPVPNTTPLTDPPLAAAALPHATPAAAPALIGALSPRDSATATEGSPLADFPPVAVAIVQESARPTPVPPPGAAAPEADSTKAQLRKPTPKKAPSKIYSNPEIRINDFFK